jgi:hypothetical protein
MRHLRTILCGVAVLVAAAWSAWSWYVSQRHHTLVSLLQHHRLPEARAALNGYHDWDALLRRIQETKDAALAQAALDVQFESWYSRDEDTNYPYPERFEVVRRLLSLGARPRFHHLLLATQQNKMRVARLFIAAGVSVQHAGASDTPLANAAYWGDLALLQQLLAHGADINQPSAKGWTPLLAAAWSCEADCVRYLLENGADPSPPCELWDGHAQPLWQVIQERASNGPDFSNIWNLIRVRVSAGAPTTPRT